MRINHKSDFDFRLDLYAADPFGNAVSAGIPDCDFSGRLFVGTMHKNRYSYEFARRGDALVNCCDCDGHLHIVVSDHHLGAGPLYCELTLSLPDEHYPSGFRSAVYSFPLYIYLTDSDSDIITPTVSVTLPVLQKKSSADYGGVEPGNGDDGNGDDGNGNDGNGGDDDGNAGSDGDGQVVGKTSRFCDPWLSRDACGGRFCSGAYVGNVYKNNGKMLLSGHATRWEEDGGTFTVYLPRLCSLLNMTPEEVVDSICTYNEREYQTTIDNDHLIFEYRGQRPCFYVNIPVSAYVTITPDCKLKLFGHCPLDEFTPEPLTLQEIMRHFEFFYDKHAGGLFVKSSSNFVIQLWTNNPRSVYVKNGKFLRDRKCTYKTWLTKKHCWLRAIRKLKFRAARKSYGKLSPWTYFMVSYDYASNEYSFFKTNEDGSTLKEHFYF